MDTSARIIVFWVVLLGVAGLLAVVVANKPVPPKATYSQFLQQVQSGQVLKATITSDQSANPVDYSLKDGAHLRTVLPHHYRAALDAMQQKLVNIEFTEPPQWTRSVANAAPFLILLVFWFFAMAQMSKHRDAK